MSFVLPKVFRVGYTKVDFEQVSEYLRYTKQELFAGELQAAKEDGISPAEALCSMFGKMCYKSLVLGQNANVKKVRAVRENLAGTFASGHGSVFEHVGFNFIVTDCSRVFTHELVRHRVGTAFSQTSGRYVRPVPNEQGELDIAFVHDPILDPVRENIENVLSYLAMNYQDMEIKLGIADPEVVAKRLKQVREDMVGAQGSLLAELQAEADELAAYKVTVDNFELKKKLTSALRRILPNGQANEIAFSVNIRTLRHCVQIRTQRFAEWEIRAVFAQIYQLIKDKFPMVFHGAKERIVDGLPEVYGMKLQPYDVTVEGLPDVELLNEAAFRNFKRLSPATEKLLKDGATAALNELLPAA